jgi:hypothetical protein
VGRASGAHGNIWGFVPAACVIRTVYFPRVVRLSRIPSGGVRTADLHRYGRRGPVRAPLRLMAGPPEPTGLPVLSASVDQALSKLQCG